MSIFDWFRRNKKPKRERIDPFTVTDPWRSFVQDALQAESRFGRIVGTVREGPLRERLGDIEERIREGVTATWRIAQTGHQLNKTIRDVGDTDSDAMSRMRERKDGLASQLAALTKNLDDAVARGAELATGQSSGIETVADDINNVVGELEALRQAIAEISPQ